MSSTSLFNYIPFLIYLSSLLLIVIAIYFSYASRNRQYLLFLTAGCLFHTTAFIIFASLVLSANNDFLYVIRHQASGTPFLLKLSVTWAGREGSLFLWNFFNIILLTVISHISKKSRPYLSVPLLFTAFILLISAAHSNPFTLTPDGMNGNVLNPLLNDVWMAIHPPLLFGGYSFALVLFGYATSEDIREDIENYHTIYMISIAAFILLSAGIATGGTWAYRTLGWGGFWGWDPVENSALLPWLLSLVQVHLFHLKTDEKRPFIFSLISALIFPAILLSVYLTRSGILSLISVHSFSSSNTGLSFLILLTLSLVLIITRLKNITKRNEGAKEDKSIIRKFSPLLVFSGVGLITTLVFFIISNYPTLICLLSKSPHAVDTQVYTLFITFFVLIALFILLRKSLADCSKIQIILSAVLTLLVTVFSYLFLGNSLLLLILLALLWFALFTLLRPTLLKKREKISYLLIHGGMLLFVIGIVCAFGFSHQQRSSFDANTDYVINNTTIQFNGITGEKLVFTIDGKEAFLPYNEGSMFKPLIISKPDGDLYISPIHFLSKDEIAGTIWLSPSKEFTREETTLEVLSVDTATEAIVLRITEDDTSIELHMAPDSRTGKTPVTNKRIDYRHFDTAENRILLWLEPGELSNKYNDALIIEIASKPLIILLWSGIALFLTGAILQLILFLRGSHG